jgi:hypothetical protein
MCLYMLQVTNGPGIIPEGDYFLPGDAVEAMGYRVGTPHDALNEWSKEVGDASCT